MSNALEKEILWDTLKLDGLLESKKNASLMQEVFTSSPSKQHAVVEHQKMLKTPTYSVLMDRYKSLPHDPKLIPKKRLNALADPIRGRDSRYAAYDREASDDDRREPLTSTVRHRGGSPLKKTSFNNSSSGTNNYNSNRYGKGGRDGADADEEDENISSFFLTGMGGDAEQDDSEALHNIQTRGRKTGASFANNLRSAVSKAGVNDNHTTAAGGTVSGVSNRRLQLLNNKKLSSVAEKRHARRNMDPLMNGGSGGGGAAEARKRGTGARAPAKKAWEDTTTREYQARNKKPRASNFPIPKQVNNSRINRKAISSGYGASARDAPPPVKSLRNARQANPVLRPMAGRLLKKLVEEVPEKVSGVADTRSSRRGGGGGSSLAGVAGGRGARNGAGAGGTAAASARAGVRAAAQSWKTNVGGRQLRNKAAAPDAIDEPSTTLRRAGAIPPLKARTYTSKTDMDIVSDNGDHSDIDGGTSSKRGAIGKVTDSAGVGARKTKNKESRLYGSQPSAVRSAPNQSRAQKSIAAAAAASNNSSGANNLNIRRVGAPPVAPSAMLGGGGIGGAHPLLQGLERVDERIAKKSVRDKEASSLERKVGVHPSASSGVGGIQKAANRAGSLQQQQQHRSTLDEGPPSLSPSRSTNALDLLHGSSLANNDPSPPSSPYPAKQSSPIIPIAKDGIKNQSSSPQLGDGYHLTKSSNGGTSSPTKSMRYKKNEIDNASDVFDGKDEAKSSVATVAAATAAAASKTSGNSDTASHGAVSGKPESKATYFTSDAALSSANNEEERNNLREKNMQTILERLEKVGGGLGSSGADFPISGNSSKRSVGAGKGGGKSAAASDDVGAQLARQAKKIGSSFATIDNHMSQYKSLANGPVGLDLL